MTATKALIDKYNVPGPRYTSYPTVPFWNNEGMNEPNWKKSVSRSFIQNAEKGISIYIHLPFCESLCTFCGCHKHITKRHEVEDPYITTILKEWEIYLGEFQRKPLVKKIHLGGGTPTFFSPENLERLILGIKNSSVFHEDIELSFEGHPNNTTSEHLSSLYQIGFTRVSFGIQDYSPEVQKAINRIQSYDQVKNVHIEALETGYTSVSHDLVFGLPKQTLSDIKTSIENTLELRPHRISLYSYAHVPWIKGFGQRGYDEKDLPSAEEKRELYDTAKLMLLQNGYHEIGMDHFALENDKLYTAYNEGTLHRNFMGYTTNDTKLLIGLGMSAISDSWYGFAQNAKSVKEYTNQVNEGKLPVFRGHFLTMDELITRKLILDLMCSFKTSTEMLSTQKTVLIHERLKPLIEDGLMTVKGELVLVSEIGKIFIRNICMCFDERMHNNNNNNVSTEKMFSKTV